MEDEKNHKEKPMNKSDYQDALRTTLTLAQKGNSSAEKIAYDVINSLQYGRVKVDLRAFSSSLDRGNFRAITRLISGFSTYHFAGFEAEVFALVGE